MHPSPCRPPDGEYSTSKHVKLCRGVALLSMLGADLQPLLVTRVRRKRERDAASLAKEEHAHIHKQLLLIRWRVMFSKLKKMEECLLRFEGYGRISLVSGKNTIK